MGIPVVISAFTTFPARMFIKQVFPSFPSVIPEIPMVAVVPAFKASPVIMLTLPAEILVVTKLTPVVRALMV